MKGRAEAGLCAWARALAESFPPWSDDQWREINVGLGYHLKGEEAD